MRRIDCEPEENRDGCTEHCCDLHGCKYGKTDCPVATGRKRPSYFCEDCCESIVATPNWHTNYVMVDIEADGPIPGEYSMISFGAVMIEEGLKKTFYAELKPISENWIPEALAVSGFSREQTLKFGEPAVEMRKFDDWLKEGMQSKPGYSSHKKDKFKPMFIADNNGFDWMFICWYFHKFLGRNPFGFSSTNLGSLYKGMQHDVRTSFKHLRKTKHTHHPVDDAKGNAEALIMMMRMGLNLK